MSNNKKNVEKLYLSYVCRNLLQKVLMNVSMVVSGMLKQSRGIIEDGMEEGTRRREGPASLRYTRSPRYHIL